SSARWRSSSTSSDLGPGNMPAPFTQSISGLKAWTTYYYCAIAQNSQGISFGKVVQFIPGEVPPLVTTTAATMVAGKTATVNGTVNANGNDATAWFRYDTMNPGTCNDTFGTRVPDMGGADIGAGNSPVMTSQPLTGLQAKTKYYFC